MALRDERRAQAGAIAVLFWLGAGSARALEEGGDAGRGARVYQRCYACHSVDPSETVKLQGPSLYRIVGRRAASVPGFCYSPALTAMGEAGLVWTEEQLDRFLADPEGMLPGNQMGFFGLPDARDRADLIAYLKDMADRVRGSKCGRDRLPCPALQCCGSARQGRTCRAPLFVRRRNRTRRCLPGGMRAIF
jgi:cytochrome c